MQGNIVQISKDQTTLTVHCPKTGTLYAAAKPSDPQDARVGDECEFNPLSEPSFFSHGKAEILEIKEPNLTGNTKVALCRSSSLAGHTLVKDSREYLLAGEGGSEVESRSAIIEKAIECKVNALLDLDCECVVRPGVKNVLYRYTARPAVITGETYAPDPGVVKPAIQDTSARRNSPNEAQVRYVRVLILSMLFIAVPCILAMTQGGTIANPILGKIITAALLVLSMTVFMLVSFKKKTGYVISLKNPRK